MDSSWWACVMVVFCYRQTSYHVRVNVTLTLYPTPLSLRTVFRGDLYCWIVYQRVHRMCTDVYTAVGVSGDCTHSKRARLGHVFLISVMMLTGLGRFVFQLIPNKGDVCVTMFHYCLWWTIVNCIPLLYSECDISVGYWCIGFRSRCGERAPVCSA